MAYTVLRATGLPGPEQTFNPKDEAVVPEVVLANEKDITLIIRRVFDLTNKKLHVGLVATGSQGSLLSPRQIFEDALDDVNNELDVVNIAGTPNSTIEKLSVEQILQKVHDPTSGAIRIIQGTAAGGTSSDLSKEQIFWECYDPTNVALRVSPVGAGGSGGGSLLSFTQMLRECYDPGVGLRMSV